MLTKKHHELPFTEQHWQLAYDLGYGRGLQRGWLEAREMIEAGLLGPVDRAEDTAPVLDQS